MERRPLAVIELGFPGFLDVPSGFPHCLVEGLTSGCEAHNAGAAGRGIATTLDVPQVLELSAYWHTRGTRSPSHEIFRLNHAL